ncbi:MAG: sodium:proton antiporter [Paludibacteraceae bacterium]|nr:sodium:proton antiporter [Paludibacteraceae bacterium]
MENKTNTIPNPWISAIPLLALFILLAISVSLFGDNAMSGASQVSLLTSSAICVGLSMCIYHVQWISIEEKIKQTIGDTSISILILLLIGMISGSWMISGVVPTLIYYGIQIMSPKFFLISTCLICSIVSLMTGSSWTTIATIGIALIGIGNALGVPSAMTAGAIISGSYFGDKISPLSDTTTLAASAAGTDLFTHIRYMLITTIPTMTITLLIFFVMGLWYGHSQEVSISEYTDGLEMSFNISLWTLLVPVLTAFLIAKKIPALTTLFLSSLAAGICAVILQPDVLMRIIGEDVPNALNLTKALIITFASSTNIETGNEALNELVSTGGMAGMLNTIWLILCAMCFGGVMVASGMLFSLTSLLLRLISSTFGLVAATVGTGFILNIVTSDQYISIILSASMYKDTYKDRGYESRLLSRSSEDGATVTSVLIPWSTCGMTQATVLGVSTMAYLPYCFFNIISPLMSCLMALIGFKIVQNDSAISSSKPND